VVIGKIAFELPLRKGNNGGVGLTLGDQVTDNLMIHASYFTTVNHNSGKDLQADAFRLMFTYVRHPLLEGMRQLHKGHEMSIAYVLRQRLCRAAARLSRACRSDPMPSGQVASAAHPQGATTTMQRPLLQALRYAVVVTALGATLVSVSNVHAQTATSTAADNEQAEAAELAKKLQNPVASLISVPIQHNWDFGIGSTNAMRYTANIQPVIPFSLSEDWNLILRTIIPGIYAESSVPGGDNTAGLGDTTQSFFFSPKEPTSGGWIWGVGPVFFYPTATDTALGTEKFGLGPTAVLLKQEKGWTYGMLFNHIWSVAGNGSRAEVNATFLQPFANYTTKTFTTFGFNTETTYDWENKQGTVPLNWSVAQLLKIAKQPMQFTLGGRYYAEKPRGGPDWGLRFTTTLLFPK
jgi:hypothetical protein